MKHDPEVEKLAQLLRDALPPLTEAAERDLWPQMRARLESPRFPAYFSWLDWVLAAGTVLWFVFFPQAIPGFFYHF